MHSLILKLKFCVKWSITLAITSITLLFSYQIMRKLPYTDTYYTYIILKDPQPLTTNACVFSTFEQEQMIVLGKYYILISTCKGQLSCCSWYRQYLLSHQENAYLFHSSYLHILLRVSLSHQFSLESSRRNKMNILQVCHVS